LFLEYGQKYIIQMDYIQMNGLNYISLYIENLIFNKEY
jgi:hypothetical protein